MTQIDVFPGSFITFVWEGKLLVRRRCVEARLAKAREQHTKFVEWRGKYEPQSSAWQQYDVLVRAEREKINREIDELIYIKGMSFSGPIVGGHMHVPGENGYRGPSIIDLFHRVAEKYEGLAEQHSQTDTPQGPDNDMEKGWHYSSVAEGVLEGLEILTNPYKFLNEEERAGYDLASKVAEQASQAQLARVQGHGTAKTGPAKRGPGRPPGSKNKPRELEVKEPQKITLFRMTESGKAERQ